MKNSNSNQKTLIYNKQVINMAIPIVEFSREGYKIKKVFDWKSTYRKEIIELCKLVEWVGVKCLNLTFKNNFLCQKLSESFWFFFIEEYEFRSTFLITSIFKSIYFLKWCPIFDSLPLLQFSKFNNFLWACWFLAKNLSSFVSLP